MIPRHTAGNPILKYLILQPLKVGNVLRRVMKWLAAA